MEPRSGLSAKNLKSITDLLSKILADAVILYTKTRKFHWNVSGNRFKELHRLYEEQNDKLSESIDEIAERINKLGAKTPGTMKEFLDMGTLKEAPGRYPNQKEMLKELLGDHEAVVVTLRKAIDDCDDKYKDKGTSDFLTDLMKEHETIAWTLRRYLQ
jgi:starvation-inducible DNA-binding protein